jgi:hypothetical protein
MTTGGETAGAEWRRRWAALGLELVAQPSPWPLPATHVHATAAAIDAALYRKRPPLIPLELWLDLLAEQADD